MSQQPTSISKKPKGAPLTPEQRWKGESNLARLAVIAKRHGVQAAMEEWDRMSAEMEAEKARNSPPA